MRLRHLSFLALSAGLGLGLAQAQEISTEAWYAVPDARGVQVVNIECGRDYIDPREIVVEPDAPVEFSVRGEEPGEEFRADRIASLPVDRGPKKMAFTPRGRGAKHGISCRRPGAPDTEVSPRKRGTLHIGHPFGKP